MDKFSKKCKHLTFGIGSSWRIKLKCTSYKPTESSFECKLSKLETIGSDQIIGPSRSCLVVVDCCVNRSFRWMEKHRNSTGAQQTGHALRTGPEIKDRSTAKKDTPKRLGIVEKEVSQILQ